MKRKRIRHIIGTVAAAVTLLSTAAYAGPNDWPSMTTNVIHLDGNKNQSNDGCRNYALGIMSKLSLNHVMTAGTNTTAGVATIQGHDYIITVRCQVESKLVVFIVAGFDGDNANKVLDLFYATWTDKKKDQAS